MSSTESGRHGARIELRGVARKYGAKYAVRDVDLTIEPGEFVTLLGPSGSGKTTTLNIIAGFDHATEGTMAVDGQELSGTPPHQREMGMVFQQYALFPHMTVLDNVMFPLKQRKVPKREAQERAKATLETVHLGEYVDRRPSQLSGGQQQRVALARAMVYGPRVLLMDEPLGALDKKLREFLQLEIKRIHREVGSTFVFVTHDQEEALVLSDRIAVFNNGMIEQIGNANDLYERPETLFVARFLGDSSSVSGAPTRRAGATEVDAAGVRVIAPGEVDSEAAVVVVRPERMRVAASADAVPPDHNAVPVTVAEEVYLGSSRLLEMRRPDGSVMLARETAGRWSPVSRGDEALAVWRVEDGVLLPDDPSAETVFT